MMAGFVTSLLQGTKAISKRLIAAYVLDWIVLIILGLISYSFSRTTPHYHAFSLVDLSISYPKIKQTVSVTALVGATVLAPAALTLGVVFVFVPGPAGWKRMSKGEILRAKLWEFNVSWLGLVMAQVSQFLVVQGMKNLIGKPRPHMLDVCQPDLNNLSQYVVGGYGQGISPRWVLVDFEICQQSNKSLLRNAFQSFPSGHSSTSWAGMVYLSLWLAAKFGAAFPLIPYRKRDFAESYAEAKAPIKYMNGANVPFRDYRAVGYRDEAAAPPTWTLFLVYIPIGVAFYISGTRYFDYYHHGFDVISGSLVGLLGGYIGYRWYHGPLGRSAGWAWSPRSRDRAFGVGVGSLGYVTDPASISNYENQQVADSSEYYGQGNNLELGNMGPSNSQQHPNSNRNY